MNIKNYIPILNLLELFIVLPAHILMSRMALLKEKYVILLTLVSLWGYVFEVTVSLINNVPINSLNKVSHFLKHFHKSPSLQDLKPFGCAVYPFLRPYNKHKFTFRSAPYVYLGYNPLHSAFRCLDVASNRIYLARHVTFHEKIFPYKTLLQSSQHSSSSPSASPPWLTMTQTTYSHLGPAQPPGNSSFLSLNTLSPSPSPLVSISGSTAASASPSPINLIVDLTGYDSLSSASTPPSTLPVLSSPPPPSRTNPMVLRPNTMSRREAHTVSRQKDYLQLEPQTFKQVIPYVPWKSAMQSKFATLLANKTWTLVP
jgi:hypothetical protein